LQFIFDAAHVEGGAHHQKFAVIDGELAFLGGLDLCDHRWDDHDLDADPDVLTPTPGPQQTRHTAPGIR